MNWPINNYLINVKVLRKTELITRSLFTLYEVVCVEGFVKAHIICKYTIRIQEHKPL